MMSVSASEVRRLAVAACAHYARADERTKTTYAQAQHHLSRAFAGNEHATGLIGEVDVYARALTEARRKLTAQPSDEGASSAFRTAADNLEHATDQLVGMTARY